MNILAVQTEMLLFPLLLPDVLLTDVFIVSLFGWERLLKPLKVQNQGGGAPLGSAP